MKKIISILLIATMLFSQLIAYATDVQESTITFKELTKIELSDIEEISIRSGITGEGVIISSKLVIENILNTVNELELKDYEENIQGGFAYEIMFGLSDSSSIHYNCSAGTEINDRRYEAIDDTEVRKCLGYYYDLYKSVDSSKWATEYIAEAVKYGIINDDDSWNYTAPICREDFCNIAVKMMETAGVILPTDNPQRPLGIKDTDNVNVLKLYKSGVILGKEHHKTGITFAPNDFITREEAATILYRMAKIMGIGLGVMRPEVVYYWDEDKASDWALDAIKYMRNIRVMDGVNGYEFYPKDTYTVEQAIATMIRLFEKKQINMMIAN